MTEFQKITYEIRQLQKELNHTGSCTTKGLTQEEVAHLDERFFLAFKKLNWLKGRRDVRGYVWKPVSTSSSLGSAHRNRNQKAGRCQKPSQTI